MDLYMWIAIGLVAASIIKDIIIYAITGVGTLKIDHSDPEKDVYRIDIDDLDKLSKKKRIVLKVDNDADLSQK
nr:MAG TPA: hypothetical protein [Caudoviricetes sp.]